VSRIGTRIVADPVPSNLQEVIKRYGIGPFDLDVIAQVLYLEGDPLPPIRCEVCPRLARK